MAKDTIAVHWEAAPPRQDHAQCARQVEDIRRYHISTGYRDIAYSWLVCIHGQIFTGRGWGDSAATCGTYWNSRADSVCAMIGPGYSPTQAMLDAIRSVILQAQARGLWNVIGHRDACSTACPGDELYAWVHSGFPGGTPAAPKPRTSQNRSNEMFPRDANGTIYLLTGGVLRPLSGPEWAELSLFAGQDGVVAKSVQMDNPLRIVSLARTYGVSDADIQAATGIDLGAG